MTNSDGIRYNVKKYHYHDGVQVRFYKQHLVKGESRTSYEKDDFCNYELSIEQLREKKNKYVESSRNRTVQNIYGIARANKWDWFITLTINPKKLDSSNYGEVTKKASQWLKDLRKRKSPNMVYILVPELHNDGKKWHIHGLISNCDELDFKETDIEKNGKVIYNLDNWKYGFSTATKIEHSGKASSYITKYITKELCERTPHKKRYWASNNAYRMNDVLEIDNLTDEEKENYIKQVSGQINYMKKISHSSGQEVIYLEI
jgi:RNA binding exosome subunit